MRAYRHGRRFIGVQKQHTAQRLNGEHDQQDTCHDVRQSTIELVRVHIERFYTGSVEVTLVKGKAAAID